MWVSAKAPAGEMIIYFLRTQLLDMGTLSIDANYLLAGHAGGKQCFYFVLDKS